MKFWLVSQCQATNDLANLLKFRSKFRPPAPAPAHRIIRQGPPQFQNQFMAQVYVRSIMRSNMYQEAPFC